MTPNVNKYYLIVALMQTVADAGDEADEALRCPRTRAAALARGLFRDSG